MQVGPLLYNIRYKKLGGGGNGNVEIIDKYIYVWIYENSVKDCMH